MTRKLTKKIKKVKAPKEFTIDVVDSRNTTKDLNIQSIADNVMLGKWKYDLPFQREIGVWDMKRRSKLIESIFSGLYIPPIVIADQKDGRKISSKIVDGCQRVSTICKFLGINLEKDEKPLKLSGLTLMPELNGKSFKDLCSETKQLFYAQGIAVSTLRQDSDIIGTFIRLQNGIALNKPELLAAYLSDTDILSSVTDICETDIFKELAESFKRKKGSSIIMNMFLILDSGYINTGMSDSYVESLIKLNNQGEAYLEKLSERIVELLKITKEILGADAFKKFYKDAPDEATQTNKLSSVLVALHQLIVFSKFSKQSLRLNKDAVKTAIMEVLTTHKYDSKLNSEWHNANSIKGGQNNPDHIKYCVECLQDAIDKAITVKVDPKRFFSANIAKKLYDVDDSCGLCENIIDYVEDAQVDHILPHSKGGFTVEDNAQLAHAYCNQYKGNTIL